jgi:serine/threonine protein kinase
LQVYKAEYRGTLVAVKKLREADTEPMRQKFRHEIGVLKGLHHPNIVLFMGACFEVRRINRRCAAHPVSSLSGS